MQNENKRTSNNPADTATLKLACSAELSDQNSDELLGREFLDEMPDPFYKIWTGIKFLFKVIKRAVGFSATYPEFCVAETTNLF